MAGLLRFRMGEVTTEGEVTKWSDPYYSTAVETAAKRRLGRWDGPYRLREEGEPLGPRRTLPSACDRIDLWATVKVDDAGDRLFVKSVGSQRTLAIRSVDIRIPNITNGNSKVDALVAEAKAAGFTDLESWGVTVCKNIGSSGVPSQHRNWARARAWKSMGYASFDASSGGNAMDVRFGSFSKMNEFANWCVTKFEDLDLYTIIWNVKVYSKSLPYWHPYSVPSGGSLHKDHVHLDFDPHRSGADYC